MPWGWGGGGRGKGERARLRIMHSLAGQLIGSTIVEDKGSLPFLRVFQQFIFFLESLILPIGPFHNTN